LRVFALLVVLFTGGLLIYGIADMPDWGDPKSPPNMHVSPRYIERTVKETATPNMVTAVLADYRGYDTLGETTVIFAAGISCLLMLMKDRP
jgi:multicomponent Na+:H+ antiporter subunit B